MARLRRSLFTITTLTVIFFVLATWIALEGKDVATLHTQQPDGTPRRTRVWIAEKDGALWVEAATAERPFYQDLLRHPQTEIERHGTRTVMTAMPLENPQGHEQIRSLLCDKYGWADVWVGLLQDTSASIGIRLEAQADVN